MGLFSKKPAYCTICNKEITHKHKPKREWRIKGPLCGDCHVDKMKEFYEGKIRQPCVSCGTTKKITDLWEPRWQWDMEGLLCKECFGDVVGGGWELASAVVSTVGPSIGPGIPNPGISAEYINCVSDCYREHRDGWTWMMGMCMAACEQYR